MLLGIRLAILLFAVCYKDPAFGSTTKFDEFLYQEVTGDTRNSCLQTRSTTRTAVEGWKSFYSCDKAGKPRTE